MTFPNMPGGVPQVKVPPIVKTVIACCGYEAHLGQPADWTCPGCKRLWPKDAPAPDAAG